MFEAGVLRVVAFAVVDVEEVGEDAGEHLARGGGGEVPVFETLVLAAEDFFAVAAGQDASLVERVEKHGAVAGKEVAGEVNALDGRAGVVEDFVIDPTDWRVGYLVVDSGEWLPEK